MQKVNGFSNLEPLVSVMLGRANGNRRTRQMTIHAVYSCLGAVAERVTDHMAHTSGAAPAGLGHDASTTVVLAARIGEDVYLGIKASPAHRPDPGSAWPCLRPWDVSRLSGLNRKLAHWVAEYATGQHDASVVKIPDSWLDAFIRDK